MINTKEEKEHRLIGSTQRTLGIAYKGVEIQEPTASTDLMIAEQKAMAHPLHARFKITSNDDEVLWSYFGKGRKELEKLIRERVKVASKGQVEVEEIVFTKGSIDILLILKIVAAVTGVVMTYPVLKQIVQDFDEYVVPKVEKLLETFFEGFKNGASQPDMKDIFSVLALLGLLIISPVSTLVYLVASWFSGGYKNSHSP